MFVNVLQKEHIVERVETPWTFFRLLLSFKLSNSQATIIIYTSLMAPFILLLKLIRPSVPVYYMVRGDEITYVRCAKRFFRALVAFLFQKLLVIIGCRFVFVCDDLKVLFEKRLGPIRKSCILPNTLGKRLPDIRPFDGHVALIGDFGTVKNVEWAIENLSNGKFDVHLYGNHQLPEKWQRPWLHAHGVVQDLTSCLCDSCSLVVLPDTSAGFSNVLVEALEAGCGIVVQRVFPFKYLPISNNWRFDLTTRNENKTDGKMSDFEKFLHRLLLEKRDYKKDNPKLIKLIESDWEKRVWEIFS